MLDIISIGAGTVDVLIKSADLEVKKNKIVVPYHTKKEVDEGLITSGGGATNSSVGFARMGLKSGCVALVGEDNLAGYIKDDLKKEKVESMVIGEDGGMTDYSVILIGRDGGRTIFTNRGKTRLEEENIDWEKIKETKWFYITSLEGNMELLEKLVGLAMEENIEIALNPGSRELKEQNRLRELLPQIDFLLLNREEAEFLMGREIEDEKFFEEIIKTKAKIVGITDGKEGSYLITATNKLFSPAINMKPIDETGAGDAFGSGVVGALFYEKKLDEALFWGAKNAGNVVGFIGAKKGLLNYIEISK